MVKKFDDATLSTTRALPLIEVLDHLGTNGFFWRRDHDFQPVKNSRTERLYVTKEGEAWELLVTGAKWFDTRAGKGGGGGIDLVMHLTGLSFVGAVRLLSESHTTS